jgi:hypothetical protein
VIANNTAAATKSMIAVENKPQSIVLGLTVVGAKSR